MNMNTDAIETRISEWRDFLGRRRAIAEQDVEELESHLRDEIASLADAGLDADEAFLVAVKRIGNLNDLSREYAREHSERLWRQLMSGPGAAASQPLRSDTVVALLFALAAALAIKVPALFGATFTDAYEAFYVRNIGFFVLPILTLYLARKRGVGAAGISGLLAPFGALALVMNLYPFVPAGHTFLLSASHLPIALWGVAGLAYVGLRWRDTAERMNFIRFTGELFIYCVLLALGGGVLSAFTLWVFQAIGVEAEPFVVRWLMPCGAMAAVVVGAWLVEMKQGVIENMAPVLTRVFTPLFTLVLILFLATMAFTGRGVDIERDVLIGFDLLLVIVLGLHLYAVSARDPLAPPGPFDYLQLALVASALIVDAVALAAIASRITEFGLTPNRAAALGENLILLVNLAWAGRLYLRFATGRGSFAPLERWQTAYLPVYPLWALIVVTVFPLLFKFL